MSKLHPRARGHLTSVTARNAVRRESADQIHQDLGAEKQVLDERTAQLCAARLAQKCAEPDAS